MEFSIPVRKTNLALDPDAICRLILSVQKENGEIPWSAGDKTDPWDQVESAMGLNIGGYRREARLALRWYAAQQNEDGSMYAAYRHGRPEDLTRDANMSTYLAVGVFHDYLITGDLDFVESLWPFVARGLDFALSLQAPTGELFWAISPEGQVDRMALLTGSSSIYMSLKCGLALARLLDREPPHWVPAFSLLGQALRQRRHLFNMTKSRFSMDWFYPVLAGALTGAEAQRRIDQYWERFVVQEQGVRCVSDQPWVTIAETSELVLALAAMGQEGLAGIVFDWIQDRKFEDATFWCGFTVPEIVLWPGEKITWTNAAALLAADALFHLTPADRLFNHCFWSTLPG